MSLLKKCRKFEEHMADRMMSFVGIVLAKLIEPDMKFNNILEIDEHRIKDFKENYGIEGIILDVDQTIRNNTRKIPECNKRWIELMKKNFKVIALTNGMCGVAQEYFESMGIDYVYLAFKPAKIRI